MQWNGAMNVVVDTQALSCSFAANSLAGPSISRSSRTTASTADRQSVVATLGRVDELVQDGTLERLLRSGARFAHSAVVLTAYEKGEATAIATRQLGPALAIERLWRETGCKQVITALAAEREFQFDLERAAFLTVLPRLFNPASDRPAEKWRHGLVIDGLAGLGLHQLYQAMGWLGDELADQSGRGIGPRTTKDLVEEQLFALRNNLFSELSLVFLDTTSLYFEGDGGQSLGQYGHSKDHRPDLKQVILAVVIDARGRPICSELWPGNTTDVTTLLPIIERLKNRFMIARIGIVADRGMISEANLAELEARHIDYIIGVRERGTKEIHGVIADPAPYVPLSIPQAAGRGTTDLLVKEVNRSGRHANGKPWRRRYIVCLNEAEAKKDAAERAAIVAALCETEIEQHGKVYLLRNPAPGCAGPVLRTLGVALPPLVRSTQPSPAPPLRKPQKRRRKPRRRSANVALVPSNPLI